MTRFQRSQDPDRPGQLLLQDGEPVGLVFWAHDFAEREQTGWFLALVDGDGEPDGQPAQRLHVSEDVARLAADLRLGRAEWLSQAETVELVTAAAAVAAGERRLVQLLGGPRS